MRSQSALGLVLNPPAWAILAMLVLGPAWASPGCSRRPPQLWTWDPLAVKMKVARLPCCDCARVPYNVTCGVRHASLHL